MEDVVALRAGLARILPEPPDGKAHVGGEDEAYVEVLQLEITQRLADAITTLPARQQTVLFLYHAEDLTLRQVGELLGVTESRVCQIHSAVMAKLRTNLSGFVETRAVA